MPSRIPRMICIFIYYSLNLVVMNYFKVIPLTNYMTIYKILKGKSDFYY